MALRDCGICGKGADYRIELIRNDGDNNFYLNSWEYSCKEHLDEICRKKLFKKDSLDFVVDLNDGGCYFNPTSAKKNELAPHFIDIEDLHWHLIISEDESLLF